MENRDIAIVGMSIFCPAGESIEEFWHGIAQGGDFITDAPEEVIDPYHFSGAPNGIDQFYCKRGGFCKAFKIDPLRYGVMPITASGTEPDHLVSMAGAEQALMDAGVFEKGIPLQRCCAIIGKGNFAGIVHLRSVEMIRMAPQITALLKSALPNLTDEDLEKIKKAYRGKQGRYQADMATGAMPSLAAAFIAKSFDMHGPAYTIDAACASGLVAINHSIGLLRSGECDIALAGGIHSAHSAMFWGMFELMGAMSRKQVIAPFSQDADGLLIGQGGGFIVLKTLRKALEDGDRIYAIINETSVCSDNASTHVMVTSVEGQTRALEQAWDKSGMDPGRIGYIEAHGTGTIVGDRVEITALKNFFGDKTYPRAYVGSVKSNIGHAMPAAGMIGVIKTALALYHRKIPPTLHCERPLSAMFESRFMPPQGLIDWDGEKLPLTAGVNSFGFGGINAHAVMSAYEPNGGMRRKPHKPYFGEALMVSAPDRARIIEKLEKGDFTNTGGNYRVVLFDPTDSRVRHTVEIVKKDKPWLGMEDIWFSNRSMLSGGGQIVFLFPRGDKGWDLYADSLSSALDLPRIDDLAAGLGGLPEGSAIKACIAKWLCLAGLGKLGVEAGMCAGAGFDERDAAIAGMIEHNAGRIPVWHTPSFGNVCTGDNFSEIIEKLYEEQQARVFIQIGLGGLASLVEDILKGKGFGVIRASEDTRGGADQLRRVMALLFIEGGRADPAFLGVKAMYRVEHSLITLPVGAPPILKALPEINDAISRRYGPDGPGLGITGGSRGLCTEPIAAATDANIRDAISIQQEIQKVFAQRIPAKQGAKGGVAPAAAGAESRAGRKFEETLLMKLEDHLYLLDHAMVRQPDGWPHPEDWSAIVPLGMTLEIFAEIAMKRAPGEKLIKISNVAANKWIEMEKPFEAAVRGEWIEQDILRIEIGDYASAECVFGGAWPEPPEEFKGDIDIGGQIMECRPPAEYYDKYSFHGPGYHSCAKMIQISERGLRCLAQKRSGKGSLLDIMGQQIGLFLHLTQTKNMISFPVRLKELSLFADIFDQGGTFEQTMIVKRMTNYTIAADMALRRGGKIWAVAREFINQRFITLMPVWNVTMKPQFNKLAEEIAQGVYYYEDSSIEYSMASMRKLYLSGLEREAADNIGSPARRYEHIFSRIVIKDAVRAFVAERGGEMLYPIEICCDHDENGRLTVHGFGRAAAKADGLHVSLAHKGYAAAAIVAKRPVGIDLEKIEEKPEYFYKTAYTAREIELIKNMDSPEAAIRFWAAKEAYAKMLGTGLTGDPKRYEVNAVDGDMLIIGDCRVQTLKRGAEYIIGWTV